MTTTTLAPLPVETAPLTAVTFDLYRNIHKAIRIEMFGTTGALGAVDPGDAAAVEETGTRVHELVRFLVRHAEHEDTFVQPAIERHLPDLASRIVEDHEMLERKLASLDLIAEAAVGAAPRNRRLAVHRVYLGVASFVADFLEHMAFEELEIMPGLSEAMSVEQLVELQTALVASIPPEEMAVGVRLMMQGMNVDDRVELLAGMKDVPAPVFQGVLGIAASVLTDDELAKTKTRLGIS